MNPTCWPHAPTHQLSKAGTYFVTAGTYHKEHFFRGSERCGVLHRGLLKTLGGAGWQLEAWAAFSNHYHFVAKSPSSESAASLSDVLRELHSKTAVWLNRIDKKPNRTIWHNFWDTRLTYESSYLARLNYVHQNAVKHGLVAVANQYPWCSAGWFERVASPAKVKSIYSFKMDAVRVHDEYDPAPEW